MMNGIIGLTGYNSHRSQATLLKFIRKTKMVIRVRILLLSVVKEHSRISASLGQGESLFKARQGHGRADYLSELFSVRSLGQELDSSPEVSLVVVVDPDDGGAGPDYALAGETQLCVGSDTTHQDDQTAGLEEGETLLDDRPDTAHLHHHVVLDVRQELLLGSELDSLLPPGLHRVTHVDFGSVLLEESTAVESQEPGTEYEDGLHRPVEAVVPGRGPGGHHRGQGAVDGSCEAETYLPNIFLQTLFNFISNLHLVKLNI